MYKQFIILAAAISITLMPDYLSGQTVSLNDYLLHLESTHPLIKKEHIRNSIEREERLGLVGDFDWELSSSILFAREEPEFAVLGPKRSNMLLLEAGLVRTLWSSGGQLSAGVSTARASLDIDPGLGFPDSYYQNELSVGYLHPLLKNKGGILSRLRHDLKEYDIDFSYVEAAENIEAFLLDAGSRFLDWSFLTEQREIVRNRLALSEEELARVQKKRKANLVDRADVIRAEDAVRTWEQQLVLVESDWKALQSELTVMAQDSGLLVAGPSCDLYEIHEQPDLLTAMQKLETEARPISLLTIRLQQLNHQHLALDNSARPNLSLLAKVNAHTAEEEIGQSFGIDKFDATIGLLLSYPLGNRAARSRIISNELASDQLALEREEFVLNLKSAYASVHIKMVEMEKVLTLNQEHIESARLRTAEELRLYNQGRGELTFVIQSRDNEQDAQLTYARNGLFYQKLLLQMKSLLDELYPGYGDQ
ncbi:MAG: TolC family protein [candidate division Zixibacteria bacterium]